MAKAKKEAKKTSLELELPIYYQSTTKYSGQKFQVSLIEINGQWVGHKYGSDTGTEKQRKNAAPSKTAELVGISTKVFWGMTGSSGELVTDKDLIASCSFS